MKIPEYAKDAIYQELEALCKSAGQKIIYKKLDDSIAGRSNRFGDIEMPDEHSEHEFNKITQLLSKMELI